MFHSSDRGRTWTRRSTGTEVNLGAIWGTGAELFAAGADTLTHRGVLLRSADRGVTWTEELLPFDGPVFDVTGTAREVYVAGADGKIARRSR